MSKALVRFVVVLLMSSPLAGGIVAPSWADAATGCTTSTSRDGTLTVCPGAAAAGAVVKVRGTTHCGAARGIDPPHRLGLKLVFLGPKSYVGSGGGGVTVPYELVGSGFQAAFRIPATYTAGSGLQNRQIPVRPGGGYTFATYPAGGCRVAFTVLASATPRLRAQPKTVTAGNKLTLVGSRFKPGQLVKIYVGPPRAGADFWGSTRAGSTGGFRTTFKVNRSVGRGDWVVVACQGSCMVKASASFKTRPASPSASLLVGIRAAHHPGYDRIVFDFSGTVPSRRNVRYVSRMIADPSGRTIRIAGRAILEVSFFRATARNLAGRLTAPGRVSFALPNVKNAVQAGDFESILSYGIGLAKRTSFHVFTLTHPSRVVIDIGTP